MVLPRLLSGSLQISEEAQLAAVRNCVLFSVGHCGSIFHYSFRMCSTVNYQLYVILKKSEELQRSNKVTRLSGYIIHVSHIQIKCITLSIMETQTRACVCVRERMDKSEIIN